MYNILFLYFFDILLIALIIYGCTRKVGNNNNYVEMPDDYAYHPEIVEAEKIYNDDDYDDDDDMYN